MPTRQQALNKWACEVNQKNMDNKPGMYKKRQAIVEHPFGTMKRRWGFNFIMTKKEKDNAYADVGFIFLAYALHRIFNILDFELLDFGASVNIFLLFRWVWSLSTISGLDLSRSTVKLTVFTDKLTAA